MIPNTSSSLWKALAPALGDHLWQSTVVALVAALLTLLLRKNHARARYWLWLAASLKFLVPFSWFVALGNHVAWRSPAVTPTTATPLSPYLRENSANQGISCLHP